jgi:hypothetical protein
VVILHLRQFWIISNDCTKETRNNQDEQCVALIKHIYEKETEFWDVGRNKEIKNILQGEDIVCPIPVAARSKARVCGSSLAGILGSNPAGHMNICL